jgi:hypothetical protein
VVEPRPAGAQTFAVRIAAQGFVSTFHLGYEGHEPNELGRVKVGPPFEVALVDFASGSFDGEGAQTVVESLAYAPPVFGRSLSDQVLLPRLRQQFEQSADAPPDSLAIEAPQPGMHAMPWELMALMRDRDFELVPLAMDRRVGELWRSPVGTGTRFRTWWVQRALQAVTRQRITADGLLGPQTRSALLGFQWVNKLDRSGLPDDASVARLQQQFHGRDPYRREAPQSVLLIRPERDVEISTQRGYSARGIDLAMMYDRCGVRVDVLEKDSPDLLRDLLRRRDFSAIHIAAPVAPSRSTRELTLQFGAGYEGSRSSVFSASLLARLLAERPASAGLPLVIVDTPRPHSRTETVRQLLCRNAFAAQLFEFGRFPAVLATGLALGIEQHRLSECLTRTLANWPTPGMLAARLRGALGPREEWTFATHDAEVLIAVAGVALFTLDPAIEPRFAHVPEAGAA